VGRAEEGKAGDRLRPTPPGSSATRSRPARRRSGSLARIIEVTSERRASAGKRGRVDGDSIVVRRARRSKAACERSGRARVEPVRWTHAARSLPVMSRQISTTEGSESRLVRREAAVWIASARILVRPRGRTKELVGGSANPRRRRDWMAIQARGRKPEDTPPIVQWGGRATRQGDEGEVAQPELRPPCPHREKSHPAPLVPRGLDLGRICDFSRYSSHSSSVDGRDARLVGTHLPVGIEQRSPRHASASSAAADPREAQQGRMKRRRSARRALMGLVQIRSCPRITERTVARLAVGRLDRRAHGARGGRGPKPAVIELARPALAARNPRRGSTGRRRRDNVCKNS